jgi:hypothetical protein
MDQEVITQGETLINATQLRNWQAALICEYGNLGWSGPDRCEMKGACPSCQERALKVMPDKPKTDDDLFGRDLKAPERVE